MAAALLPDSPDVASDIDNTPRFSRQQNGPNLKLVYLQCYFVTIATILGTGILGLPVTLSHSGLYPFILSFLSGFLVQVILVYFFTEILQRAHAVQLNSARTNGPENVPLNEIEMDEDFYELEDERETNGPVMAGHIIMPKDLNVKSPNLHLLGELFLPCGLRQLFDLVLLIQFVALLISYALAGSEAFAQVIGIDHFYVIPVFVWVLTFAVVFGLQIVQPVVSLLTFAKGTLLLATVIVTFFVGTSIHHEISNDFTYVGAPFLMGTVALGGVINVMPFLYAKIQPVPKQVRRFRGSIVMGLVTCTVLNVLWCWAVLDIVPQTNSCFTYKVLHNNSMHILDPSDSVPQHRGVCAHNLSLESAEQNGEISTIPLTEIIHSLYPAYDWVALLVELFIMISITVSYLTIGAAMHHTLSGWTESVWNKDRFSNYVTRLKASRRCHCCSNECICRSVLSLVAFGVVFTIAMLNPKGFEAMLEKAASLFINLEAGLFVYMMIRKATNTENSQLSIPLPLSTWGLQLQYLIPIYFCFAVFYDIFTSVYGIVYRGAPLPWEHVDSNGLIVPIEHMYTNQSQYVHYNVSLDDGSSVQQFLSPLNISSVTDVAMTTVVPTTLQNLVSSFLGSTAGDTNFTDAGVS